MKYLTITNEISTPGRRYIKANHGHQLKDWIGGLVISKLLKLEYVHTPYEYLDFFTTDQYDLQIHDMKNLDTLDFSDFLQNKHGRHINQIWGQYHGHYVDQINLLRCDELNKISDNIVLKINNGSKKCKIKSGFKNMRVYRMQPCVVNQWFRNKFISHNILDEIIDELTNKFKKYHKNYKSYYDTDKVNVAVHIGRGVDYNDEWLLNQPSFVERHMFSLKYFETIFNQLRVIYGDKIIFHIYTEENNSEEIVSKFCNKKDIKLHIGNNRTDLKYNLVHDIFYHFVMSDILIPCNSAFSVVASYYRKNKITIYHPHEHLFGMPKKNGYIPTSEDGIFDTKFVSNYTKECGYG